MKRLAVAAVTALMVMSPTSAQAAKVDYVVDGDTIRLRPGVYVRLIGIDTPEVGECGYRAAKWKLNQWVGGNARLVNPARWTTVTVTGGCFATSTTQGVTPA